MPLSPFQNETFTPRQHPNRVTLVPTALPQEGIMPQNLLEQLRKYTVVVADTGDIDSMEKFQVRRMRRPTPR
jgi:hypothetical protein